MMRPNKGEEGLVQVHPTAMLPLFFMLQYVELCVCAGIIPTPQRGDAKRKVPRALSTAVS